MDRTVQKKYGSTLVFALIAMIIVGFLFTGYETFLGGGTLTSVGNVNGKEISIREYQNAFNGQLNYLSQLFGGKPLNQKQIEQFKVKENTIQRLVNTKVLLNLAEKSGLGVSTDELKKKIKDLPYFKTNEQFDPEKYKNLLKANRFSPAEFENSIKEETLVQYMNDVINSIPVSKASVSDELKFKDSGFSANIIKFSMNDLRKSLPISTEELNTFLENKSSQAKLESLYQKNITKYKKEEERKARHILLSTKGKKESDVKKAIDKIRSDLTPQNFSEMAKKHTEDPSGKANGGELGWFSKGRMVPEFSKQVFSMKVGQISKPVKTNFGYHLIILDGVKAAKTTPLEKVKAELAKEYLRDSKNDELKKFTEDVTNQLKVALEKNDISKAKSISDKYSLRMNQDQKLNVFNILNEVKSFSLKDFNMYKNNKKTAVFKDVENITVMSSQGAFNDEVDDKKQEAAITQQQRSYANTLIQELKDKSTVTISNRI